MNYRIRSQEDWSWWRKTFPKNGFTAYAGAGWLFHNQDYFARPDNTGRALFRYVGHFDLDLYQQKVVFFGDFNMFTDREASNVARPTELDWILSMPFVKKCGKALHCSNGCGPWGKPSN